MKCSTVSNKEPVVMANYRISPSAKEDLERIWLYGLNRWGMEAADAYHAAFFDHFEELAKHPRLYAEIDIRFGYRRSLCAKDSVFYRIDYQATSVMSWDDKLRELGNQPPAK